MRADDHEREEWRSAGLRAGVMYAEGMARPLFEGNGGRIGQQRLIEMLSDKVREQCTKLRAQGASEPNVQEYGRALTESIMSRLRESAGSMSSQGGSSL